MKYSEIFLKAAELVAEHEEFSCNAIDRINAEENGRYTDYCPARCWYCETLGIDIRYGFSLSSLNRVKDSQNRRVIMLCLAAAIAESEGL